MAAPVANASDMVQKYAQGAYLKPIDMVLYCPNCGLQHVDAPETCPDEGCPHYGTPHSHPSDWLNPPHRSHLCHECGCIWRPADVPTNGVERLQTTGKADTWGGTRPEDRRRRAFHQPTASTRNDNGR